MYKRICLLLPLCYYGSALHNVRGATPSNNDKENMTQALMKEKEGKIKSAIVARIKKDSKKGKLSEQDATHFLSMLETTYPTYGLMKKELNAIANSLPYLIWRDGKGKVANEVKMRVVAIMYVPLFWELLYAIKIMKDKSNIGMAVLFYLGAFPMLIYGLADKPLFPIYAYLASLTWGASEELLPKYKLIAYLHTIKIDLDDAELLQEKTYNYFLPAIGIALFLVAIHELVIAPVLRSLRSSEKPPISPFSELFRYEVTDTPLTTSVRLFPSSYAISIAVKGTCNIFSTSFAHSTKQ